MDASAIFQLRARLLAKRLAALERAVVGDEADLGWAATAFRHEIEERRRSPSRLFKKQAPDWGALESGEKSCERLFQEGLVFLNVKGRPGMEPGLESLAASLVATLTKACKLGEPPLIVPHLADSYSDFVPIIRIRFPAAGLWDVPVVAHEFGHYAAYRMTAPSLGGIGRSQELAELIDGYVRGKPEAEREKRIYWINEFFADMFATYVLGFAFAASLLLLRFDLSAPYRPGGTTHPSPAARAKVILYTLQRMNKDLKRDSDAEGPFVHPLEWLNERWSKLLEQAEGAESPDDFTVEKGELYQAITSMAKDAVYTGWPHVEGSVRFGLAQPLGVPRAPVGARDLLNGAWLRLTETADEEGVEQRATEWWCVETRRDRST